MRRSVIIGTGSAFPRRKVSNTELIKRGIDSTDQWIVERSGIRFRHIASEGETTVSLAVEASRKALANSGQTADSVGLIILATTTPDHTFPASAVEVQAALGIADCVAFDLQAVCTGFLYALSVADNMIRGGMADCALVIGSETMSRIVDWNDRATCVLFGDGAGAVVLQAVQNEDRGILATRLHADGQHQSLLYVDGGPSTTGTVGSLRMKGAEVFRLAVPNLTAVFEELLATTGHEASDIDWVVPHQANRRILEATARKMGIDMSRMIVTIDDHANTSAASVPLALDHGLRAGRLKKGDLVVLEAFGGGVTWGGAMLRL